MIKRDGKRAKGAHTEDSSWHPQPMGLLCCSTRTQIEINSFWFGHGDCSRCSMQGNGHCIPSSNKEKGNTSGKIFRSNVTLIKMEEFNSGSSTPHWLHVQHRCPPSLVSGHFYFLEKDRELSPLQGDTWGHPTHSPTHKSDMCLPAFWALFWGCANLVQYWAKIQEWIPLASQAAQRCCLAI